MKPRPRTLQRYRGLDHVVDRLLGPGVCAAAAPTARAMATSLSGRKEITGTGRPGAGRLGPGPTTQTRWLHAPRSPAPRSRRRAASRGEDRSDDLLHHAVDERVPDDQHPGWHPRDRVGRSVVLGGNGGSGVNQDRLRHELGKRPRPRGPQRRDDAEQRVQILLEPDGRAGLQTRGELRPPPGLRPAGGPDASPAQSDRATTGAAGREKPVRPRRAAAIRRRALGRMGLDQPPTTRTCQMVNALSSTDLIRNGRYCTAISSLDRTYAACVAIDR